MRAQDVSDEMEVDEADAEAEAAGEDDVPVLINPELPNLKAVLDAADVVVEVLDARDPLASRSAHLEEVVQGLGKRVVLVLNKVGACSAFSLLSLYAMVCVTEVRGRRMPEGGRRGLGDDAEEGPPDCAVQIGLGMSARAVCRRGEGQGQGARACGRRLGPGRCFCPAPLTSRTEAGRRASGRCCGRRDERKFFHPPSPMPPLYNYNELTHARTRSQVGKTSFVNSLLRKAALQTYRLTSTPSDAPTTTTYPQEVTVELEGGKQLRVIDTPGLSWHTAENASPEDTTRLRARDILLRSRGHIERLKDPSPVCELKTYFHTTSPHMLTRSFT